MQRTFEFALYIFHAIVALLCTASAVDIYVSADGDVPCRSAIWNIPVTAYLAPVTVSP